jgi:D-arginine dehydrogenase
MTRSADVVVVGAGIAGASLAAEIAGEVSVILIEAEDQPGYHSTGRSAAFWAESYGGPAVQPLTSASGPWLAERGLLRRRGALHLAGAEGAGALEALRREAGSAIELRSLAAHEIAELVAGVRPEWDRALFEPSCADIDVAALHASCLALARRKGAQLVSGTRLLAADRHDGGWLVETSGGTFAADILVDAAGAWADEVAAAAGVPPLGIRPFRRTLVQLRIEPPAPGDLPLVIDALGRFYFKPEPGGRLWLSPHDETACDPGDCAPEEYDVALAIDWLEKAVEWKVEAVERSWAGLRSFAPDRVPVYGYAPGRRDFFWFAGQGGFGIQTAPAAAMLAASLLLDSEPDPAVAAIDPAPYLPDRLATSG